MVSFYIGLWAWRLYDFYNLVVDDTESLWLFMKWLTIDGIFLFGLPALRIPWLEWGSAVMAVLFMMHALLDGMLMFKIGIPVTSWFIALTKLIYNYETAISERKVKADDLIHNASLILGRQVIHILPEGSAMLNPQGDSFCLDGSRPYAYLPIQINQTNPIGIELLRMDINSEDSEVITIKQSEAKSLRKAAAKELKHGDDSEPLVLKYPVKKTGYYTLQKVLDESKLEVAPRRSHALVVSCPVARVKETTPNRCSGDLSNIALEVTGTPPLRLKYRKTVNEDEAQKASLQSLQPDDFVSPLAKQQPLGALTKAGDMDVSWAQSKTVIVPLNETLNVGGLWSYEVEQVSDGLGNVVSYSSLFDENERSKIQSQHLQQSFFVHEKPLAAFTGHNAQRPLRVAKGQSAVFPVKFTSTGRQPINEPHTIDYWYTPEQDITVDGTQSDSAQLQHAALKHPKAPPQIHEPGLYTLHSVSSEHCVGEVLEPSSLILQNPPEPDLAIETEDITDRCANRPIGKKVFLDLVGSPPFTVKYKVHREGDQRAQVLTEQVNGHKGEILLTPREAGRYNYQFLEASDSVYKGYSMEHKNLRVQQDVKPPPYAVFLPHASITPGCIDEAVQFGVILQGEGPWELEYELVRAGKRNKHKIQDISDREIVITTEKLTVGGEYTLSLVSVTDSSGCTELLKEEARISVRHQRPQAAFMPNEGKFNIRALEGKAVELKLRLTGEPSWDVHYMAPGKETPQSRTVRAANGALQVSDPGTYTLVGVRDTSCPGSIDKGADTFEVNWLGRPTLHITESDLVSKVKEHNYIKEPVCEGDEDSLDISFSGKQSPNHIFRVHPLTYRRSSTVQGHIRRASSAVIRAEINAEA